MGTQPEAKDRVDPAPPEVDLHDHLLVTEGSAHSGVDGALASSFRLTNGTKMSAVMFSIKSCLGERISGSWATNVQDVKNEAGLGGAEDPRRRW